MKCEYCSSGIKEKDKVCSRCGAPNEKYYELNSNYGNKPQTFGELISQIENTELTTLYHHANLTKKECI